MQSSAHICALDVGTVRIGVALALAEGGFAAPYTTLINDETFMSRLEDIVTKENVIRLVVGRPRGLGGQITAQTKYTQQLSEKLKKYFKLPISVQDEAVTSIQAEAELKARKKPYRKEDIDALSATYILEDFLREGAAK